MGFFHRGILAIALLDESDRRISYPRFSALALWAAIAVVVSGAVNAWTRLNFAAAWSSGYARVVAVKIILTAILLVFGYKNRKLIALKSELGWGQLRRFIFAEALVMAMALALGSWLGRCESTFLTR